MKRFLALIALFFLIFTADRARAVGISPPSIKLNDVFNGMELSRSVTITRKNADKDAIVEVYMDGEISKYVKLSGNKLDWPKGQNRLNYDIVVAPLHAPNGAYQGLLRFVVVGSPGQAGGGNGTSFQEGAGVTIILNVTDQEVKKLSVLDLRSDDTEINVPPAVNLKIQNEGNVDANFTKIKIAFYDLTDPRNVIEDEINDKEIPLVPALTTAEVQARFHKALDLGRYLGKIQVFMGDTVVFSRQDIYINVYPPGTLAQKADFNDFSIPAEKFLPNEIVKFSASIQNIGEIAIEPVLYIEIKKDDKILDILRSEKKLLLHNSGGGYTLTYRPNVIGKYSADAYFEFGAKKTDTRSVVFLVGSNSVVFYIIGGGVLILVVASFIFFILRKKNRAQGGGNLLVDN